MLQEQNIFSIDYISMEQKDSFVSLEKSAIFPKEEGL